MNKLVRVLAKHGVDVASPAAMGGLSGQRGGCVKGASEQQVYTEQQDVHLENSLLKTQLDR